ncbi:MAG: lysine--tRNA ligase [Gammaproteobacteria bacterium]|nr:lysine--tRNA ligase [Gammaproteobacteria bacterium]MYF01614.1 lysine--tRNA ligase [Gammaproteobacteria bacterium]MYI76519.1 lysine--tRNA ligase [Gammaproteobacteria bacterium]
MNDRDEVAVRRKKLARLRELGEAFPNDWRRTHFANDLHREYVHATKEQLEQDQHSVALAGRIVLRRDMGRASFVSLRDVSGALQCYLRSDSLSTEEYTLFKELTDLGDIVGISGTLMRTNKGELTVQASEFKLLTKSLQPYPSKYQGIEDQELKYRRRYLDLIANESSRKVFETRTHVIKSVREFFDSRGYLEVETPMMHPIPGGAVAKPFVTHHNVLETDLFLRVAPELYLKRLVVGGFERVYEINRNFRNEGLSTRHNPEFTMLEFYQAYGTYEDLIVLTSELIYEVAQAICQTDTVRWGDHDITFAKVPKVLTMEESVASALGVSQTSDLRDERVLRQHAAQHDVSLPSDLGWGGVLNEVFETLVEPTLIQPCFIVQYPVEISPLARRNEADPLFADRFEYFVGGREIANGFSELNDPEDQAERFQNQVQRLERGDDEAMHFDQDYITALQYGLPPTAGEGLGIDRLVMLFTNTSTIRDVLLFPQMKSVNP